MNLDVEPDRRCPRHVNEPPPYPCGACADRREHHAEWARQKNLADAKRRSDDTRQREQDRTREIANCRLCDQHGYRNGWLCDHGRYADAATRGAAMCRAAMNDTTRTEQ